MLQRGEGGVCLQGGTEESLSAPAAHTRRSNARTSTLGGPAARLPASLSGPWVKAEPWASWGGQARLLTAAAAAVVALVPFFLGHQYRCCSGGDGWKPGGVDEEQHAEPQPEEGVEATREVDAATLASFAKRSSFRTS